MTIVEARDRLCALFEAKHSLSDCVDAPVSFVSIPHKRKTFSKYSCILNGLVKKKVPFNVAIILTSIERVHYKFIVAYGKRLSWEFNLFSLGVDTYDIAVKCALAQQIHRWKQILTSIMSRAPKKSVLTWNDRFAIQVYESKKKVLFNYTNQTFIW
ncbi:MAG: hypothetical protein U5N86_07865 [Planctomycetota bacterium]|nr:hypothetical protein [Planctomycetota bacterium]